MWNAFYSTSSVVSVIKAWLLNQVQVCIDPEQDEDGEESVLKAGGLCVTMEWALPHLPFTCYLYCTCQIYAQMQVSCVYYVLEMINI